jgi:hypothetical protein
MPRNSQGRTGERGSRAFRSSKLAETPRVGVLVIPSGVALDGRPLPPTRVRWPAWCYATGSWLTSLRTLIKLCPPPPPPPPPKGVFSGVRPGERRRDTSVGAYVLYQFDKGLKGGVRASMPDRDFRSAPASPDRVCGRLFRSFLQ